MNLFYKPSDKEMLEKRNRIFLDNGVPALTKRGFKKSPFSTSWFGRNNLKDFTYEFCRVTQNSLLETITVHISKGDKWIKIYLNIFQLRPDIYKSDELQNVDGLQYHLAPNNKNDMRLRIDDYRGIPLLNIEKHKVNFFLTKASFEKRINELSKQIEKDLSNINYFINRWHEMHKPMITTWEGNIIH